MQGPFEFLADLCHQEFLGFEQINSMKSYMSAGFTSGKTGGKSPV